MDKVLQDYRLHPKVKKSAIALQETAKARGITILYTQGYRTLEYQGELYAQGRTKPGKIVTNCRPGHSPHNYGLAVDFVPMVNGKAAWDRVDLFDTIGHLAKEFGLFWGGYFHSFVDKPHLENLFGLKISDLLAGKRPQNKTEGGPKMTPEDAQKIVALMGATYNFTKAAGMPQTQLDEIHRLTDEVRKAGGLPTA